MKNVILGIMIGLSIIGAYKFGYVDGVVDNAQKTKRLL